MLNNDNKQDSNQKAATVASSQDSTRAGSTSVPSISLPKGGGAIRGIGEKFGANPVTGTGSMTVPIATSPGRSGFGPQLSLSYDSGAGNGPFGLGWNLSLPAITRKTDRGLPRYQDAQDTESDVFILSGAEDLVPVLKQDTQGTWTYEELQPRTINGTTYRIRRYRPRVEGLFARIERWTNTARPDDIFWRSISKDNITTWYGRSDNARIADPAHPERIFSWLICETYDDKGNIVTYHYKAEDAENVDLSQAHESNRGDKLDPRRTANRYLKYIRYGNHIPYLPKLEADQPWPEPPGDGNWYFEVVFDYGEHAQANPTPQEAVTWTPRQDAFSSYRSTFEVRTQRLCQRVLMFHHVPDIPAPNEQKGYDGLVCSTDFTYEQYAANLRSPIFSKLVEVTQRSYQRQAGGGYLSRSLPPLEFTYSDATIQTELRELRGESLANLPVGIDGAHYQWVDLDGEGLSGVLTEQADAWFYKRNLSPTNVVGSGINAHIEAMFAPLELVSSKPAMALVGNAQFLDMAGDGRPDVVQFAGPTPGFYERTMDEQWDPFVPFISLPNVDWSDPNLKFIDLDGDGHADILISEHDAFVWHHSLGEDGFDAAERTSKPWDEEQGPSIVFADGEQSISLADMSGDGLNDIVRIRNSEVCYWPNLGYGRFGTKVTMDNAPLFDSVDQFDHRRLRLADIDGTGTTDLLYLHSEGVRVYFNQSGNSWSAATTINVFPALDNVADVQALDLLGNGTACLVWSSPLPGEAGRPLRYLDLMGGQKPHLLIKTVNNLGAETTVAYAPSTRFYLQDKAAGNPWITKLPFPVHCVEKLTVHDTWRNTTFSTTYSYHHGYFDGPEREFRGFGRVEQVDVEDYGTFAAGNTSSPYITDDHTLYQPPVKTVTWYHTGVFLDRKRILSHFQNEYFPHWFEDQKPGQHVLGTFQEHALPEPELDALDLTADEWREALRACKGMTLRQEVYELDVDGLAAGTHTPVKLFSAAYHNCHIHRVQPQAANQHAVFHVTESEAITYHYELDLRPEQLSPDPRIAHALNVSIDEYGNIQQSVAVVSPRLGTYVDATLQDGGQELIQQLQSERHLAYSETRYTNDVDNVLEPDSYRLRLPCEVLTYELTGIVPGSGSFTLDEVRAYKLSDIYQTSGIAVEEIAYHLLPNRTSPQKRTVEHARSLFFATTLDTPLVLGQLNVLGLPYESYKLALSDDILNLVYKDKLTLPVKTALSDKHTSGYLSGGDLTERFGGEAVPGQYWMCAGVAGFNTDAPQHFYLPESYTDPFGNPTALTYDQHDLLIQSSTDALGNTTRVTDFDFRVLAPREMQDINDNLSEVFFDVRGLPTAMAVMSEENEGDKLTGFDDALANPALTELTAFFNAPAYNEAQARSWLDNATARHVYSFGEVRNTDGSITWGTYPPCACSILRERHVSQLAPGEQSPVQAAFEYSDGMGSIVVKKVQAEPEVPGGPLRWIASGKTILNNKGKPVKQYEPYFTPAVGHRFEEPIEVGVTHVLYYDAVGRVIRTESPNGSYSRVEFSPWHVQTFDQNDTVKESKWYTDRNPPDPDQPLPRNPITGELLVTPDQRAAWLAAQHHDTPSLTILDSLGRGVVALAHNRVGPANALVDEKYVTFSKLDAEGKPLWVQDPRGNRVMQYIMPPLPDSVHPFNDASNLNAQGFTPCYDIAGNLLFQHSMDAGDRWMLNDAAGKPMLAWNSRMFITQMTYDELHRPTASIVTDKEGSTFVTERIVYGETAFGLVKTDATARARAKQTYHLGKPYQVYDSAGVVTNISYDFKSNLIQYERILLRDPKTQVNWPELQSPPQSLPLLLENEIFVASTQYDALNRPVQIIAPHREVADPQRINITQPVYNEANLLERVDVWLNHPTEPAKLLDAATVPPSPVGVNNIDYDAKGQRLRIDYKNAATTQYAYDLETFRLIHLYTRRGATFTEDCDNPQPPPSTIAAPDVAPPGKPCGVQNLYYTYDPVGNITQIRDDMQDRVYHSNACVLPGAEYRYDALYRLVAASGREHKGDGQQYDWDDSSHSVPTLPNDCQALQNYVVTYRYDPVGNIMQMVHQEGRNLEQPGQVLWNRRYQYALDSNRLLATSLDGDAANLPDYVATPGYSARYTYDPHGNITAMPHLPQMSSDFKDQLSATTGMVKNDNPPPDKVPATTYYVYDAAGQRVRKITERQNGTRKNERTYLGGFEVYREYDGNGTSVSLERETLHVMDDKRRIALVETKTIDNQFEIPNPQAFIRYQFGNHLGSASLELDDVGQTISYEEYTPYGSTSYQAGRSAAEVSLKRYRYTGMERDEESGFSYHGARYYAPWLGRWVSCDVAGLVDGANLYQYTRNNPIVLQDTNGMDPESFTLNAGPFRLTDIKLLGLVDQLDLRLSYEQHSLSINRASLMGELGLSSKLELPSLDLKGGKAVAKLNLRELNIEEGLAKANLKGSALLETGSISSSFSVYGHATAPIDEHIVLNRWQEHVQRSFEAMRGQVEVFATPQVLGVGLGFFAWRANTEGSFKGTTSLTGRVGLGNVTLARIRGTGTFSSTPGDYKLSGSFSALVPPLLYAQGKWSFDMIKGLSYEGYYLGPQKSSPMGLDNPTGDVKHEPSGRNRDVNSMLVEVERTRKVYGDLNEFTAWKGIGYTYFSPQTTFSAGVSPHTSGAGPWLAPYIGASFSTTFWANGYSNPQSGRHKLGRE